MSALALEFQALLAPGSALERVSRELGLRGAKWEMPGIGARWQFTTEDGITFYTAAGATVEAVRGRLKEKLKEFGRACATTTENVWQAEESRNGR